MRPAFPNIDTIGLKGGGRTVYYFGADGANRESGGVVNCQSRLSPLMVVQIMSLDKYSMISAIRHLCLLKGCKPRYFAQSRFFQPTIKLGKGAQHVGLDIYTFVNWTWSREPKRANSASTEYGSQSQM